MKKITPIIVLITLALSSCIVSNSKFFAETQIATDSTYGYTDTNPIRIKNGDLNYSINSSYYYISRLRTIDDKPFELVGKKSVLNPKYEKPAIQMVNRYTGQPINGNAMLLDKYYLLPKNSQDTVIIFINPYEKGIVQIPVGLKYEKE